MSHSNDLSRIYNTSLSNLTDLYQLTMAYGYWKNNIHETESVFHMFFRNTPFKAKFAINAGLAYVIDYLQNLEFNSRDLNYLFSVRGSDGKPLFDRDFLNYLQDMTFSCTVDAIEEGRAVFGHEPLLRIRGPIIQCQMIETALLNIINFQTLIATKAFRVCFAAEGDSVVEFGLRRAQGIDGALAASRAAYIGGCTATSNVLAGQLFGIPVIGTHAHSWIMSFDSEEEAFAAYANSQPNNCTFLVDTYDTIQGVKNAIKEGKKLVESGHKLNGIRLDSGDLAKLSIEARKLLDEAGFTETKIVASNDLDEAEITRLKKAGAKINVWGVGTKMVTAYDQPALGGVYKLGAIKKDGEWVNKIKLSSDVNKMTNPGILDVLRGKTGDVLVNQNCDLASYSHHKSLLVPIFVDGKLVYDKPDLTDIRKKASFDSLFNDGQHHNGKVTIHPQLQAEKEELAKSHV